MKNAILFLLIVILAGCQQDNKYILNGSFDGPQNEEWIYMVKFPGNYNDRDSAKIENGKFVFTGIIDTPQVYYMHYQMDKIIGVNTFFLEPGTLNATINLDNWDLNSKVEGGKLNDEYNKFLAERLEKFLNSIFELQRKDRLKEINDSISMLWSADFNFSMNYIKNNSNSLAALHSFYMLYNGCTVDETSQILSQFHPSLHNTLLYKKILDENQERIERREKANSISLTNETKIVKSDFKGAPVFETIIKQNPNKVLYVDFWATWCGPCKQEFPSSKKLYEEIDTTKISMIYLCISSEKENWKQTIKLEGLKGQHFFIDDEVMKKLENDYNLKIPGIPRYIIIGKDGKIVNEDAPRPSSEETKKLLIQLSS